MYASLSDLTRLKCTSAATPAIHALHHACTVSRCVRSVYHTQCTYHQPYSNKSDTAASPEQRLPCMPRSENCTACSHQPSVGATQHHTHREVPSNSHTMKAIAYCRMYTNHCEAPGPYSKTCTAELLTRHTQDIFAATSPMSSRRRYHNAAL